MNPQLFPEADHSHGCVTDGLITVPDDHQLNGEVEITVPDDHQLNGEVETLIVIWHRFKCQEVFDTISSVAATEHLVSRHAEYQVRKFEEETEGEKEKTNMSYPNDNGKG
ncbi:hypothetical protein Tco_1124197 [Tanacetum coccineum]|uniref:Uncharacterized protein n=1 Tax=Tanacetum coccineum TaxID=301880 RepID=A0ABQ5J5G9_9ASTR